MDEQNDHYHTDRLTVLQLFFERVTQIASQADGVVEARWLTRPLEAAIVAQPQAEDVPSLQVAMPTGLQVEFASAHALSAGDVLTVEAKRSVNGHPKDNRYFNHVQGEWRQGLKPLSDDDILQFLTLNGPPLPQY
jgi:hypothetical protein